MDRLSQYLSYLKVNLNRSDGTVLQYKNDLQILFNFVKQSKSVSEINDDVIKSLSIIDLDEFMFYLAKVRKNSARTRARKVAVLKDFFGYLYEKKQLFDCNIAENLKKPKIPIKYPKPLSLKDTKRLLEVIYNDNSSTSKDKIRNYTIITIFLNCGLRESELCGLDAQDLDLDNNMLEVTGKGDKQRNIYFSDAVKKVIEEYLNMRKQYNFSKIKDKNALFISNKNNRISTDAVYYTVRKYLNKADIDTRIYHTHSLRHSFATNSLRAGNNIRFIQKALGHKSLETVQVYLDIADNEMRQAAEKVSSLYK